MRSGLSDCRTFTASVTATADLNGSKTVAVEVHYSTDCSSCPSPMSRLNCSREDIVFQTLRPGDIFPQVPLYCSSRGTNNEMYRTILIITGWFEP